MKVPVCPLKQAAEAVKLTRFLSYREYLQELYLWLKENLEAYSYLQLAADLGFSKTNIVHLIIRDKRRLSLKGAQRMAEALALKSTERQFLELLVIHNNARLTAHRDEAFEKLLALKNRSLTTSIEQSQLRYYSEWYHPVIREMCGMESFQSDAAWIAQKIHPRILPEQARRSLELLQNLGFISFDTKRKRHVQASTHVSTGDEIVNMAVVRYHHKTIELARESITSVPDERRDISAVTVLVSQEVADKLKVEIQKFRKKLLALSDESSDADQIYQINIQLFPFTK